MIWFFLPAALVISNDIWAYIVGITFGRTQLIKLSPKKTVEGFVGAWIMTVIFGFGLTHILMKSRYFICPVNDLGATIFTGLECKPNPVFLPKVYELPQFFFLPPGTTFSFTMAPMQFHSFMFATFASLIAPFGGFFASGLKRTFKIKDFGDSIPGHGGMTDRMDCQFIMGFFTFVYYHTFIALSKEVTLGEVMEIAINGLTLEEQAELIKGMGRYLANHGILDPAVVSAFPWGVFHPTFTDTLSSSPAVSTARCCPLRRSGRTKANVLAWTRLKVCSRRSGRDRGRLS